MSTGNAPINVARIAGKEIRIWELSFTVNGGSDPTTTVIPGAIATVVRTGTGTYRVRFIAGIFNTGSRILCRMCHLNFEAATGNRAHAGPGTVNADGTTDITVFTVDNTGAATDLAANSNRIVSLLYITED